MNRTLKGLVLLACLSACSFSYAKSRVVVTDKNGVVLSNIVVEISAQTKTSTDLARQAADPVVIEQIDQQFVPHISVVPVGTQVTFPNNDTVAHHVYSFSPAKTFEVNLQEQFTSKPISFDSAGIVELGCNIHDWMLAYVFISDADWFGKTNAQGIVDVELPEGSYSASVWHPRLSKNDMQSIHELIINQANQVSTIALSDDLLPSLTGYDSVGALDDY
ncbi:methylamine utilization protein [Glaciecola siphonariae]|uniref:Methylamine utilization protein n=1 Tax=Glaciecola siphonariae TaxID=521012 RepID=A0ABV9LW60_9ALTE